jgi:catechol 2,3-dioxygenase-like lactoylglutathione lyase family enzyme
MHLLHHLSFGVADLRRSAAFYDAALGALGFVRVWSDFDGGANDQAVGYGREGGGDKFAIKQRTGTPIAAPAGFHLAFSAADRDAVHRFHAAALAHGGRDNGAPGPRPHYGPHYYAAFVIDPDGYHVEAVVDTPDAA